LLVAWFGLRPSESPLGFYLLFAGTASVQVVAVYLVFASLIVPPLIASDRLIRGYALGILGYVADLLASGFFDLPAGSAIVVAMTLLAAVLAGLRTPASVR